LKFLIKNPFERVKGLILGAPLGEIFAVKNDASNQNTPPSNKSNVLKKNNLCLFPLLAL
jgi:hypothetical protein